VNGGQESKNKNDGLYSLLNHSKKLLKEKKPAVAVATLY